MATGKRYYWIKLKESFMTSDVVDFLMSQKDGANYVVLYQMLCLKTINTDGRLSRQIGEIIIPYDVEKIQRDCKWFSADTIRVALELYTRFGLVYRDESGTLVMADHENLVGSETDAAARMRSSRAARNALPPPDVTDEEQCANNVTPDIRDKSIDDRDKEIREESTDRKSKKNGAERSNDHSTQQPEEPPVFLLTLNDGSSYGVTQSEVDHYSELYPAVDVAQEIRGMIGWLYANPQRRKTKSGIRRFMNNWLSKTQDQGGTNGYIQKRTQQPDRNQYDNRPQAQGNPFADVPDFEE